MMVRRLSLAGAALLAGGLLLGVSPTASSASSCGSGPCPSSARASVAPHDVLAGSSAGFTFTVNNLGNATLDSVRVVRPSTGFSITGVVSAPTGWTGVVDAPDGTSYATFSSPIGLAPGQTASFKLTAAVAAAAADSSSTWSVLSRNASANLPNGNNYQATPGVNNTSVSLLTTTHVLSTGRATLSPAAADDGTVTAGQTVTVALPVTNVGTAAITPSAADSGVKGDTDGTVTGGTLVSPPTIAPGATATLTYTGVTFPQAGPAVLRVYVANNAVPVYQAAARVLTVQTPAGFAPAGPDLGAVVSALQCSPAPANPGRPLSCSLAVDKNGDVAATLSTATTLAFSDGAGHTFSAPLSGPVAFSAGNDHQTITFAPAVVPTGFAAGAYNPTVTWAGTDANGAAVSAPPSTLPDAVVVDDAPTMVTAASGQDSQGNPNVSVTISEPVSGTYDVNNWKVVDSAGVLHAVVAVAGSPSAFWTLTLARSPAPAAGPLTVTYCGDSSCAQNGMRAGDLHDRQNSPLATQTIKTA